MTTIEADWVDGEWTVGYCPKTSTIVYMCNGDVVMTCDTLSKIKDDWRASAPICPKCGENFQIQLVDWLCSPWKLKCRACKHKWQMTDKEKTDGYR
jgi:hypothetical protein